MGNELYRRRALLDDALMMGGPRVFEKLGQAFAGASDEQREALADVVSPETLLAYEGPTPRACYLLLATSSPEQAAKCLVQHGPHQGDVSRLVLGAVGRTPAWVCAFVEKLPSDFDGWRLQRATLLKTQVQCASRSYLRAFVSRGNWCTYYVDQPVESLMQFLREDPGLLDHELIAALSTPGIVDEVTRIPDRLDIWVTSLARLASKDSGLRTKLLDATVRGLFREVSASEALLHIALHEVLDPNAEEVAGRVKQYCLLLSNSNLRVVQLAQTMLRRNLSACPSEALLAGSHDVFGRNDAWTSRRQVGILREWALLMPTRTQKVRSAIHKAEKFFGLEVQEYVDRVQGPCTNDAGGQAPKIPQPKVTLGTTMYEHLSPLPSIEERQFSTCVSHIFGQIATGTELQSVLDYLGTKPDFEIPDNVLAKSKNFRLFENFTAPRIQLARLLSAYDPEVNEFEAKQAYGRFHYDSYEWSYTNTNAPVGVLGALFQQVWQARSEGRKYRPMSSLSHQRRNWELMEFRPKKFDFDRLDGISTGLVWHGRFDVPVKVSASVDQRILDTLSMFNDYQDRGREALSSHDNELVMQWAAWLLQHNLDTLAALGHPAALIAGQHFNAYGLAPVLHAVATANRPLEAPEYSLLALTGGAVNQQYRDATASALASLAQSGVFDGHEFADQVARLWSLGVIHPVRIAATLADAAQLNAMSGFRILEALERILNQCEDIGESETLLRLTATLSLDYGTPISLPSTLTDVHDPPRAIGVLLAVNPNETKLAALAASQAQ
ncbi:MAG: hypothetical protein Q4D83_08675 [Corynebacterium sp.]|nr:hypothetical protein [Corynebacterium sp.]